MTPTVCAICGSASASEELYPWCGPARPSPGACFQRGVRRTACTTVWCDAGRVDWSARTRLPRPPRWQGLYADSLLNYETESANLRLTYGRCLVGLRRDARLSRGAFWRSAAAAGSPGRGLGRATAWSEAWSRAAMRWPSPRSDPPARSCDLFRPGLFPPAAFDVVCMFQVFDHVPEPVVPLDECLRVLRPGGLVPASNHNIQAWSARILGSAARSSTWSTRSSTAREPCDGSSSSAF